MGPDVECLPRQQKEDFDADYAGHLKMMMIKIMIMIMIIIVIMMMTVIKRCEERCRLLPMTKAVQIALLNSKQNDHDPDYDAGHGDPDDHDPDYPDQHHHHHHHHHHDGHQRL